MEEGERIVIAIFPVFREAAASIKPCDGAFDDPTLGFYDEALGLIASPDDLVHEIGHDLCDAVGEDRPGIGAVGEQLAQGRGTARTAWTAAARRRRGPARRRG